MLQKLTKSILAGISIAIGATIFLLCENKIVGSLLFAVGILMVMEFKLLLYTGYVPTQRENQTFGKYVLNSTIVFIGNLIGGALTSGLLALTRLRSSLYEKAVYDYGKWHGGLQNTTYSVYEDVWCTGDVKDAVYLQQLGYAKLENGQLFLKA